MSTTKTTIGLAGILGIAAILSIPTVGTAIYEIRAKKHAQMELSAASDELDAATAQMRALDQKLQSARQTQSELLAEEGAARAAAAAGARQGSYAAGAGSGSSSPAGTHAAGMDPAVEGQKFLNSFPQVRPLLMQSNESAIQDFAAFFRQANLTPGQIQQFQNLMATTWAASLVETPTQMALGPNSDPTPEQLGQIIGDQAAQEYFDYKQTMQWPYKFTGQAAAAASEAGAPLSDQQNDQIAQIIADNASPYQTIPGTIGPGNWNAVATAVNWDAAIAQVKAALSPAQFSAVQGPLLNIQFQASLVQAQQSQAQAKQP